MKRQAGVTLGFLVALTCLVTYLLNGGNEKVVLQANLHLHTSREAANAGRVSDNHASKRPEATERATPGPAQRNKAEAQRPAETAPRSKAKNSNAYPAKTVVEIETAEATATPPSEPLTESAGGGGEVTLPQETQACSPDSYTVQPCSFEDWTYIYPKD